MKPTLGLLLPLLFLVSGAECALQAQDPAHATEFRMQHPGEGPDGVTPIRMLAHRLGTDHAEGISLLDMDGDGHPDLLSGSYWYKNPGANGGEWTRHQFRTVGIHNEFVFRLRRVDRRRGSRRQAGPCDYGLDHQWCVVVPQPRAGSDREGRDVESREDRRQLRHGGRGFR